MEAPIGSQMMCDLRFSIFCEHPRASFYTEPFHMCYYHGVETDLVNLTTYIGYELWKVSTTCGLFLESVRATSVIFFLGVGSLVCYKLYGYYRRKRRPRRSTVEKSVLRRKSISRWVSRELLDSCLNREPELYEIRKEYFGPVDYSDDEQCSSCSELGADIAPLKSTYSQSSRKLVTEVKRYGSSTTKMGPSHSSRTTSNAVVYNVRTGVNVIDSNKSKSSKDMQRLSSFDLSGHSISSPSSYLSPKYTYTLKAAPQIFQHQRPRSLPSTRRRRKKPRVGQINQSDDLNEAEHIFTLSMSSRDSRRSVEIERNDTDEDCSSRLDSEEEMVNDDGDDEEEDGEFGGGEKRSESMVGNYSLQSLWGRHQEMEECDDKIELDEYSCPPDEWIARSKRKLPVFVMQSSRSVSLSDEECQSETGNNEDPISFNADLSPITGGFVSGSRRSLARDNSFGTASEISEISLDVSAFNTVGKLTEVRIDEIQREIDDLKRDCLDMETHFGSMNAHGPTPAIYTELVKPNLSDISECSDFSAGDCNGGDEMRVEGGDLLRRTIFKHQLAKSHSGGSADSSFEQPSANSSSSANRSANLSLEWDSMKCTDVSGGVKPQKKAAAVVKASNNGGDSGSDFGTPLTNCSPEPASVTRGAFERAGSLEWDEEFSEHSRTDANKISQSEDQDSFTQMVAKVEKNLGRSNLKSSASLSLNCKNNSSYNLNCGVEAPSNKNMWSSMESGYIEEFTESGVSCLVTPMADDKIDKHCIKTKCTAFCEHDKQSRIIRTWPVVGEPTTTKQLCTLFQVNNDFIKICHHLQIKHFRPMHQDKYSILRATLLQMLIQGYSPLEQSGGVDHVKRVFSKWTRCHYKWLSHWCYPKWCDEPWSQDNCLRTMLDCLQSLDWMTGVVLSSANTETAAVRILNTDPEIELQVVEAAKLLMLKSALELYESISLDKAVPIFALRLFSRETSSTPEAFMYNHLNRLGYNQEMEPMELFLLGYALGVTICVINPSDDNKDDVMNYFPDCKLGHWPEVYLVKSEETGQICVTLR